MVSQIFSIQNRIAVNGCIEIIPKGKHIAIDELEMTDRFAALVLQRLQVRWAAFKEMRGISSQVADVTRGCS